MTAPSDESLNALRDGYLRQIDRYQRAIHTAKSLATSFSGGQDASAGLRRLDRTLREVAEIQEQIAPVRDDVDLQPTAMLGTVQEIKRQLADTIKALIDEVAAVENEARRARDRLAPELSQETRRQKMRATYGKR